MENHLKRKLNRNSTADEELLDRTPPGTAENVHLSTLEVLVVRGASDGPEESFCDGVPRHDPEFGDSSIEDFQGHHPCRILRESCQPESGIQESG